MTTATTPVPAQREPELAGQTVAVIGGSAGIGLETARRARAEGAAVILTGRNPDRLQRAAAELGAQRTAAFDATDFDRLQRFFNELPTPFDHVLVTGPGPYYAPLADLDRERGRRRAGRAHHGQHDTDGRDLRHRRRPATRLQRVIDVNDLLKLAIEGHGGLSRWEQVSRFRATASITGAIWALKGKTGLLDGVVLEGETRAQRLTITPFPRPGQCTTWLPDRQPRGDHRRGDGRRAPQPGGGVCGDDPHLALGRLPGRLLRRRGELELLHRAVHLRPQ